MKTLLTFILLAFAAIAQGQSVTKDSVVYKPASYYLVKAGNQTMGKYAVLTLTGIGVGVMIKNNEQSEQTILAVAGAGTLFYMILDIMAGSNVKKAGLSLAQNNKITLYNSPTGIGLCYKF